MAHRLAQALGVTALALVLAGCGGTGTPGNSSTGTIQPGGRTTEPGGQTTEPGGGGPTGSVPTFEPGASTGAGESLPPVGGADIDFARLATGETPSGWAEVLSADGACREAVPADWILDAGIAGMPMSSDFYASALVSRDTITSWADEIANLKATFFVDGQTALLENDEMFVMRETVSGGRSLLLSLNGDTSACGLVVSIAEVAADQYAATAVQILYTLAETNR